MAKITQPLTTKQTVAIVCDRCQSRIEANTAAFENVTQIRHRCGYGSVWEDGHLVEADLCEACLKTLIGRFSQVSAQSVDRLQEDALNPEHSDDQSGQQDRNRIIGSQSPVGADFLTDRDQPMASKNTLEIAEQLLAAIQYSFRAHINHPNAPGDAVRLWDRETPYSIHPTWCAMTLLCETSLDRNTRYDGAVALQWHDLLEDTKLPLPKGTPTAIAELVDDMTFDSFSEERVHVWSCPPIVRLLKLVDKTSNLLDCGWMKPDKQRKYAEFTARLADDVETHYGTLNIVRIAQALIASLLAEGQEVIS